MLRRAVALLLVAVTPLSGCASTHPRVPAGWAERAAAIRGVALIEPHLDVSVKYIDTNRFLTSSALVADAQERFLGALRARLAELGYPSGPAFVAEAAGESSEQLDVRKVYRGRVVELSDLLLLEDPGHELEVLPPIAVSDLPSLEAKGVDADLALYAWGEARLETGQETYERLLENFMWNLLLLPISVATAFIPLAMPLTVSLSANFWTGSADTVWVRLVLVDLKSGKFVYHNDYFQSGTALFMEDVWIDVTDGLLEELPEREEALPAPTDGGGEAD